MAYHLVAPLSYLLQLGRRGKSYDLVQVVESNRFAVLGHFERKVLPLLRSRLP